jgi:hypothetical protein
MHARCIKLTAGAKESLLTADWLSVWPGQAQMRIVGHVLNQVLHDADWQVLCRTGSKAFGFGFGVHWSGSGMFAEELHNFHVIQSEFAKTVTCPGSI